MNEKQIEDIYYTLAGVIREDLRVPGVENLFAPGRECADCYSEVYTAYERLCERLGVIDADGDVEIIINSLMRIERIVSMKMFQYGRKFASNNQ